MILPAVTLIAETLRGKGSQQRLLADIEIYEKWSGYGDAAVLRSLKQSIDARVQRRATSRQDATHVGLPIACVLAGAVAFIAGFNTAGIFLLAWAVAAVAVDFAISRTVRRLAAKLDGIGERLDEGEHWIPAEVRQPSDEDVGHARD